MANVLNCFPKPIQPAVTRDLRQTSHAETRAAALAAIETFREKYAAKYRRGVACLTKDGEALLAFYDFKVHGAGVGQTGRNCRWAEGARPFSTVTISFSSAGSTQQPAMLPGRVEPLPSPARGPAPAFCTACTRSPQSPA